MAQYLCKLVVQTRFALSDGKVQSIVVWHCGDINITSSLCKVIHLAIIKSLTCDHHDSSNGIDEHIHEKYLIKVKPSDGTIT